MESLAKITGLLVLFVVTIVFSAFSWGYVMYKFWYWFLLPVFPLLPKIMFNQALGLSIFTAVFKNHNSNHKKDEDESKATRMLTPLIAPWILLGVAYIIKLFI